MKCDVILSEAKDLSVASRPAMNSSVEILRPCGLRMTTLAESAIGNASGQGILLGVKTCVTPCVRTSVTLFVPGFLCWWGS
jgi:hypothetical protein